ncbi:MAG: penicillin-binding protein 2 [Gammaproteobacteria bacterium CG11_big_fil_rev_8_21_14_0_20_46_22]|nr:MAG: penicillin-binding protein 2 [Gammaproteobacteria bacterium CG12_big_fil_rev_8_21_14_0_65_46_12]PIR10926.1 MAG: penicillin-binding protein 2 [Gammaproteobacteria bacterium CG11_big_fil_rev_8_21_14_0_20_46_22]
MIKKFAIKNRLREARLFKRRLWVVAIIIALLILAIIVRLVYLQIDQHRYYTTLSRHNQIALRPIPPRRGLIDDSNGVLLAKNTPVFSLMVKRDQLGQFKSELAILQTLIPISDTELKQYQKEARQRPRYEWVPIKEKLSEQQVAIFSVNRYRLPGFSIQARLMREYPTAETCANVVGYVGRINPDDLLKIDPSNYAATNYIGKRGIERYFESQLHGKVGYKEVETTSDGTTVRDMGKVPAQSGVNLTLTIDSSLQKAMIKDFGTLRGAAVAINPQNGKVLALVSNPTYDPNLFVKGISASDYAKLQNNSDRPLYNRAISGLYAPGSTIKPFFALQGLDTGAITPETKVYDRGWFRLKGTHHIYHNWDRGGFGWVNLHDAIVLSDDIYFYQLAHTMGIKKMEDILRQFGFGTKTGIELADEANGVIPSPQYKMGLTGQSWYEGDTVITGIGQGYMQVTPLQLAEATATLAMHGKRFQPQLLKQYQIAGNPVTVVTPKPLPPVTLNNAKDWDIVIQAMQSVVSSPRGTGFRFGKTPYTVAAKTGTAQVYTLKNDEQDNRLLPERERDNSFFIAFAPVDHPQIALAVAVENNPDAPVIARKIMDYYLLTQHHWQPQGSH